MRLGETRVGAWLGLGPESEFAVRLPSLLAGSATLILLWWWTRRIRGGLAAAVTTGLYAVMLEPLVVSRLGTPDAMLALAWFAGLAFGFLAVEERRPLWWIPAWLAVGNYSSSHSPPFLSCLRRRSLCCGAPPPSEPHVRSRPPVRWDRS